MKTEPKTAAVAITYNGKTYEDAAAEGMRADDERVLARKEAAIQSAAHLTKVTLPTALWRGILPLLVGELANHSQRTAMLRLALTMDTSDNPDVTPELIQQATDSLKHDEELAGLLRWGLDSATRQIAEELAEVDPFFAIDFPHYVEHVAPGIVAAMPTAEVERVLGEDHQRKFLDSVHEQRMEQEAKADDEVTRELAKFAADTDNTGKTLN